MDYFLSVSLGHFLGLQNQVKFCHFSSILYKGWLFIADYFFLFPQLRDFWEEFRISNFCLFFWSSERFKMWKLSFCRFACTEASAGRFPPAIRPAAQRGGDRHSAGPPVGHVCCEAQRYEGGRYRRAQGTVTFFDHCSLSPSLTHEHTISWFLGQLESQQHCFQIQQYENVLTLS